MDHDHPHYKWIALSNTTLGMLLATINASIVLISLPAIFRGHRAEPARSRQRQLPAVDADGLSGGHRRAGGARSAGSATCSAGCGSTTSASSVFTFAAVALSFDPFHLGGGALWLIGWRVIQGIGGAMLMASSSAILTDAFPANQRGMALGRQHGGGGRRVRSSAC